MAALLNNTSAVHDQNEICILHGRNTLGNDDLSGIRQFLAECLTDQGIGLGIDCRGRVIQNQDGGVFQQGDARLLSRIIVNLTLPGALLSSFSAFIWRR